MTRLFLRKAAIMAPVWFAIAVAVSTPVINYGKVILP